MGTRRSSGNPCQPLALPDVKKCIMTFILHPPKPTSLLQALVPRPQSLSGAEGCPLPTAKQPIP